MEYTYAYFEKSARYVREKLNFQPEIGIILGSALGPFAAQVENPVVIPYEEIPHFLRSTVATHAGKLICGTIGGKGVVCICLLYTSPSPRDIGLSRMPSSA